MKRSVSNIIQEYPLPGMVIGLNGETSASVLLMSMVYLSNCLLNIYIYVHVLLLLSVSIS